MALTDSAALTRTSAFTDRVTVAVLSHALDVLAEADDANPANVEQSRKALARSIVVSPSQTSLPFIWVVAANPAISQNAPQGQEAIPDGDIEYVVQQQYNAIATSMFYVTPPVGVTGGDPVAGIVDSGVTAGDGGTQSASAGEVAANAVTGDDSTTVQG